MLGRGQYLSRLAASHEPRFYPAWRLATNPGFIPLGGLPRAQVLSRLAASHEPSIYAAWRLATSPAFIPLGGYPRAQCLSRLAATREPSVYPAWRLATRPVFVPLGGLSPNPAFIPLAARYAPSVRPAWRALHEPSIYPAWRLPTNSVFIPLGGCSRTQCLSRLAVAHEPSVYPAWRMSANPAFIPLGGLPRAQCLPRLAVAQARTLHEKIPSTACGGRGSHEKMLAFFSWVPGKVAAGRKGGIKNQDFSPLAAVREASVYPAWWLATNLAFTPLGGCRYLSDGLPRSQELAVSARCRYSCWKRHIRVTSRYWPLMKNSWRRVPSA